MPMNLESSWTNSFPKETLGGIQVQAKTRTIRYQDVSYRDLAKKLNELWKVILFTPTDT